MAQPKVHGAYGGAPVAGRVAGHVAGKRALRRDPQLVADPAHLDFVNEAPLSPMSPMSPRSPRAAAYNYDPAFVAAAVNPNVVYSNGRAVYVPTDPIAVVREQYCMCAPKTENERRLMVIVVVLAVVSLALLITLGTLLPSIFRAEECTGGNCTSSGFSVFELMRSRLEDLVS